jgi:hypothetical protein
MTMLNTTASAYFPRADKSASIPQLFLVAAAAAMTATIWASAMGGGDQPTGFISAASAGVPVNVVRVTLPPVQIVARRETMADASGALGGSAGCAADRSAHKPG